MIGIRKVEEKELQAAPEAPLVSIIIPMYNAAITLDECLSSIHRSTYPHREIIVIDDHSSDQGTSIAHSFPNRVIVLPHRQGPSVARNRGAEQARGSILLFVDSDVVVEPETVGDIVRSLGHNAAAVMGMYDESVRFHDFVSDFKNLWLCYMFHLAPTRVAWFWSGCGAVRRKVFEKVGGFDERLRECEDYDLGYRIAALGEEIRLDRAIRVAHRHRRSLRTLLKNDFERSRTNIKILLSARRRGDNSFATNDNALRVILVYVALLALGLVWVSPFAWAVAGLSIIAFIVLNRQFFAYIRDQTSFFFSLKAAGLTFIVFVVMGLGAATALGTWVLGERLPSIQMDICKG